MKRNNFGTDFDIDSQRNGVTKIVNKAYITYWDRDYNVIQESTMYSETVFPITILEAIRQALELYIENLRFRISKVEEIL